LLTPSIYHSLDLGIHIELGEDIYQINDDGKLNILIFRAKNLMDIFRMIISLFSQKEKNKSGIRQVTFSNYCRIESRKTAPVQADGDVINKTPIEVKINSKSLLIIVNHKDS